jgi:hypothetical protein
VDDLVQVLYITMEQIWVAKFKLVTIYHEVKKGSKEKAGILAFVLSFAVSCFH